MPKPSLGQVNSSVPDPLYSDNIQLNIPNVPVGASALPLLLNLRTGTKPGMTIAAQEVQLFGHTLEYASNLTYNHDLSCEYVENRFMQVHDVVESWMEFIRAHDTQHGAYKSEYAVNADLTMFDNKGNTIRAYRLINLWPTSLGDVSFDGSAGTVIPVQVTWKFDWFELRK